MLSGKWMKELHPCNMWNLGSIWLSLHGQAIFSHGKNLLHSPIGVWLRRVLVALAHAGTISPICSGHSPPLGSDGWQMPASTVQITQVSRIPLFIGHKWKSNYSWVYSFLVCTGNRRPGRVPQSKRVGWPRNELWGQYPSLATDTSYLVEWQSNGRTQCKYDQKMNSNGPYAWASRLQ